MAPVIGQSILSSLGISSSAPGGVESTEAVGASRPVADLGSELVDRFYSASPDDEKGGVLQQLRMICFLKRKSDFSRTRTGC